MFPAHGHYNGSLALALLLKKSGHSVYYACSAEFQQKVHSLNIDSYLINPFIISPSNIELKEKGLIRFVIETVLEIFQSKRYQEIDKNISSYDAMIERLKPDLILIDELHFSYKSIFYWKYKILTATVQTAISSDFDPAVPPFVSTYVPNDSKINNIYISFLWNRYFIKRKLKSLLNNFSIISRSSHKIFSYYSKLYDFRYEEKVMKRRLLGIRFKHIPSLVIPPEAFEFPRINKNNLFFIGPINKKSDGKQITEGRL